MRTITLLILWLSAAVAAAQSTAPQITIPRGDRLTLRFPCQYPDGTAVNVSNWTLEASIRASLTGAAVTNYTETAGAGGTNGVLSWSWDVGLAPGRYLLGFRWTTADGIVFTPLPRAPFMVLPSLLSPTNGEAVAGAPPSTRGDPREWIFTSTVSPTAGSVQSLAVNVGLRGPTGATGPQGDPASTNGLVAEAALGLLAWSNAVPWSLVEGEPTFLVPGDTNGYASLSDLGTLAFSNAVPWALVEGEPTFLTPADTNGNWGYATTQIYQPGTLGPFSDAPASASLQSYNGGSGETYYNSGFDHAIRVHAYRTNFAGTKYYATAYAQSDTFNDGSGESENYTLSWQWGAVAGAHGYLVLKSDTYSGYAYDYGIETTSTSWEDDGTGFSALTATPTTAITSNLVTVPTLQTAVLHGAVLRGTTDVSQATLLGLPTSSSLFPATNWVAYANPSFPLWSPPYFGNIQSALVWLASAGSSPSATNHACLQISGQWRLSGGRHDASSANLAYLSIDASAADITCDVGGVGDVKGWITFGSSVRPVFVKGGRWYAYQTTNNNGAILKFDGGRAFVSDALAVSFGTNNNLVAAFTLAGQSNFINNCVALTSKNISGTGFFNPINIPANGGSFSLFKDTVWDVSAQRTTYFHLGQDAGSKGHQFLRCTFIANTTNLALFLQVPHGAKWEGCNFVNLNQTFPLIGRVSGDTLQATVSVVNCSFNTTNIFGRAYYLTTGAVQIVEGYEGIRVPTFE